MVLCSDGCVFEIEKENLKVVPGASHLDDHVSGTISSQALVTYTEKNRLHEAWTGGLKLDAFPKANDPSSPDLVAAIHASLAQCLTSCVLMYIAQCPKMHC